MDIVRKASRGDTTQTLDPNPTRTARNTDPTKPMKAISKPIRMPGGYVYTWHIDGIGSTNGVPTPGHWWEIFLQPVWANLNTASGADIAQNGHTWDECQNYAAECILSKGQWFDMDGLAAVAAGIYLDPGSVLFKLVKKGDMDSGVARMAAAALFASGLKSERQLAESLAASSASELRTEITKMIPIMTSQWAPAPGHITQSITEGVVDLVETVYRIVSPGFEEGFFSDFLVRDVLKFMKGAAHKDTGHAVQKAWCGNCSAYSNAQLAQRTAIIIGAAASESEAAGLFEGCKEALKAMTQTDCIYHFCPLVALFFKKGFRLDGKTYSPAKFFEENMSTLSAIIGKRKTAFSKPTAITDWERRANNGPEKDRDAPGTERESDAQADARKNKGKGKGEKKPFGVLTKEQAEEVKKSSSNDSYADPIMGRKMGTKVHMEPGGFVWAKSGAEGGKTYRLERCIYPMENPAGRTPANICPFAATPKGCGKKARGNCPNKEKGAHETEREDPPSSAKRTTWAAALAEQAKRAHFGK